MKIYPVLEVHSQRLIAVGLVAVLLLAFVAAPTLEQAAPEITEQAFEEAGEQR